MNHNSNRIKLYSNVSKNLARLNQEKLKQILADAKPMHAGIGGQSCLSYIDETPVFIKKVPLTDLEQAPQNFLSTANLFNLPLSYQYGIGSTGFGAWRELATHILTSNWVITGECPNFPILYHWCIFQQDPTELNLEEWGDIDAYCQYWEHSRPIRKRVECLNKASSHIALFLEYIPQNLYEWLSIEISKGSGTAELAIASVDAHLKATSTYMNRNGLIHFDAHFKNILTDGRQLYFSDFGLALSSKFDISTTEAEFLKRHQNYDTSYASLNLLLSIFGAVFKKDPWDVRLREHIAYEPDALSPAIASIIKRHMPIGLIMDEFLEKLRKENKSTPYPDISLKKLLTLSSETT